MLNFSTWKISLILLTCFAAFYISLPNIINAQKYPFLPENKINPGLDLKGGSYLLLEININEYVKEQLNNLKNEVRTAIRGEKIDDQKIRYQGGIQLVNNKIELSLIDSNITDKVVALIKEKIPDINVATNINKLSITYTEHYLNEIKKNVVEQSIEIVRRRVDETGTREPDIQRQGENRILLQVPGLDDPEQLKRLLGKTAKLTFHLLDETAPFPDSGRGAVAPSSIRLKSYTYEEQNTPYYYVVKRQALLTGDMLIDARASFSQGHPVVNFRLNNIGAKKFADITKNNVGKPFAIVLDNKVVSAPVIREPILGGSGQISGGFTTKEVNDLAILLRAGALPAPLEIIEERSVGPSLGADSVEAGKKAMLAGVTIVIILMLAFYGLFGLFCNIALLINIVLITAVLSLFNATLTMPGIAGIVLTMGMAVDANVLIFERIREETMAGKTPFAAIDHGFKEAFRTILDANITTLIAAFILFNFGSGPIKGFAVTLSAGILTSMFSAILLTRLMIVIWLKRTKPVTL